ncbi:FAD-dependent oxidoreductase [Wolbachia endosymbiont of Pentidionis agamae]|uniref:FAD-dependent oxidoreductase n=1 Tax=Wolbachia endosymbiont of Pentidionis agamae TaxID=3110435 RepID=UPI002FD259A5
MLSFHDLYSRKGIINIDKKFLSYIKSYDINLFTSLTKARKNPASNSYLIIDLSYLLDEFLAQFFNIEKEVEELKARHSKFSIVYKCKRLFVQRYVLKKYQQSQNSTETNINATIDTILNELSRYFKFPILDQDFAEKVMYWFENKSQYEREIELAARYVVWRVSNKKSILFSIHKQTNYENLVPIIKKEIDGINTICSEHIKRRYGFDLTQNKVELEEALDHTHYCIFCHKQNKDSCSKGLFDKKNIFKKSPLGVELHGCPLEQKISEMNMVKSEGYSIGSLAIVMIDNPLCAATGYRICNDCSKSCIYQKQEPVDIPMVETKVLSDVLDLPYGFEIYSLLSRWNPLNFERPFPREDTGKNILVAGLGPAGFTLAHHLLNDGHNVIAIDGLKIEPLSDDLQLIKYLKYKKLSERVAEGFGGVAEYGITSRWNKNYLRIIRLLLERRKNFAVFGGVRFGGTITIRDAFSLGFDHIALALGSGKPKIIKLKNMLLRGVRMASDFLMSLQLTGTSRFNSIANLQIRMPVVVIGAGLTAIDTATESFAYYSIQVEKFLYRYEILVDKFGKNYVEKDWNEEEKTIASEFISHALEIRKEKTLAKIGNRPAKILELMQKWGGVKIIYRKELVNSPAYRLNSEEITNALSEGIYFIENLEPLEIIKDEYNHAKSLKLIDTKSGKIKEIKARSIFIAAGTEPNTVIATEEKEYFKLNGGYFTHLDSSGKEIEQIFFPKMHDKDRILAYKQDNKTISFFGDLHPSYSGSVVKAMASAKNGYKIITKLLSEKQKDKKHNTRKFFKKISEKFTARIIKIEHLTPKVIEIIVKAPLAAKNFKPGQFFRLQNFEMNSTKIKETKLAIEGIAVTGAEVDKKKGIISVIVLETGGSTDLCQYLKVGEQVVLMGPTGSSTKIS